MKPEGLHVNFARDPKYEIHDSMNRQLIEFIAYIYILSKIPKIYKKNIAI